MDPDEVAAIEAIAADYIEGWYRGDEGRMDRALHPDLVKRTMVPDQALGDPLFRVVTKDRMMEMTAAGGGEDPDSAFEVTIDDISGDMAAARTVSKEYVDYLQLVKTPKGWRIANVLFRMR
jgi:hypothetical protein